MEDLKRPNTKGMISRCYRMSTVRLAILNTKSDVIRYELVEDLVDKVDPVRAAVDRIRPKLAESELIYRKDLISDRKVIVAMSPEEFLFAGRILEYIPNSSTSNDRKDEDK